MLAAGDYGKGRERQEGPGPPPFYPCTDPRPERAEGRFFCVPLAARVDVPLRYPALSAVLEGVSLPAKQAMLRDESQSFYPLTTTCQLHSEFMCPGSKSRPGARWSRQTPCAQLVDRDVALGIPTAYARPVQRAGGLLTQPTRRAHALLALGVIRNTLPVDKNARLVSDNPSVMPRRADHDIPRAKLHFLAVVHDDLHAS
jgi:hypothetical protein